MRSLILILITFLITTGCKHSAISADDLEIFDHTAKEKIVVAVVGDTGTGGAAQYRVAQSMYKVCQKHKCDFALVTGDNIYDKGTKSVTDKQFETKFEKPYAHFGRFDFWMILGNHDRLGNDQSQIDYSLKSPRWRMLDSNYAIPKLPSWLHMYGVDRFEAIPHSKAAKKYLCGKTGWKILFDHYPLYSNGRHGKSLPMILHFLPVIKKCGVHTLLSGHDHHLEHIAAPDFDQIISGSGAKLRPVKKSDSTKLVQKYAESKNGFVIWR